MLFFHDLRDKVPERDCDLIGQIIEEERRHLRRLAGML